MIGLAWSVTGVSIERWWAARELVRGRCASSIEPPLIVRREAPVDVMEILETTTLYFEPF